MFKLFIKNKKIFFYFYLFFISTNVCRASDNSPTSSSGVHYLHNDNLGSTSVVTDQFGKIEELIDYKPFGNINFDHHLNNYNETRKYIGELFDTEANLQYLNARYYNPLLAKFISQDPEFWNLSEEYLVDPQQLNSYSYSRNNPIVLKDPFGLSSAIAYPAPKNGWSLGQRMGTFNGVVAYYNGIGSSSTRYSCVEYAKRYISQVYGINNIGSVGDARTMWNMVETINNRLSQSGSNYSFSKNINGSSSLPKEGDLLFWTEGKYGHVMVATESGFNENTGRGYVEVIDQNASNQAVRSLDIKKTKDGYTVMKNATTPIAGWFSPKLATAPNNQSLISAPTPGSPKTITTSWYQKAWNSTKQFFKNLTKR